MCFSSSVSFAASGLLLAAGGLATHKACTSSKKYLPLAIMPIFAGLQQFTEGFV